MTAPEPSLSVNVDVTNPGQFFACCGLLELAHRLWPGVEGWFDEANPRFVISREGAPVDVEDLFSALRTCEMVGLSAQERQERDALEAESRQLKKQKRRLSSEKEDRRKELGTQAREGAVRMEAPFSLVLDWWQTGDDDAATPKTWAGRQEIHKVARAAQDALSGISEPGDLLNHGCVLRTPQEYRKKESERDKSVEPFYFDARRFAHALDAGFSLDVQNAETVAHPGVELLSLVGLQRFRPSGAPMKWSFDYWIWLQPMPPPVAAGVVSGCVPTHARRGYRFLLQFRDDQKRYKAFSFATPVGDHT